MPVVEFMLANLLVLAGALNVVRCLRWRGVVYAGVVTAVWYFSQINFSILLAGIVLRRIDSDTVLLINTAITVALLGVALRWGRPLDVMKLHMGWEVFVEHVREVYHNAWASFITGLMLAEALWMAFIGYIYPTYDYDGLAYHLVSVATWLQAGRFALSPLQFWSNVYPQDVELFYTWLVLFLHNDALVNTGQLFFAVGGTLAVVGIAGLCGLGRPAALGAGGLFFLTPIVVAQLTTNYVDVAFGSLILMAFYFVFRYLKDPSLSHLLLFGLAAGLAIGSKSSGVSFVAVDCAILIGAAIYHHKLRPTYLLTGVGLVAAPIVVFAAYWYIRTWVLYDNPVYPYTVALLGHTIFAGKGSVQAMIIDPLAPSSVLHKPFWQQVLISWLNEPPHDHVTNSPYTYLYDQRLGGFGPQWILFEFPALIAYGLYAARKQREVLFAFLLPFAAVFFMQPAMWWTRYVLFIVAPGAIALAFFLERLRPAIVRIAVQFAAIGLVLASLYVSSTQGYFAGKYVIDAVRAQHGGISESFWFPEYAWVDHVPAGSTIGWVPTADHWQIYPLFGSQWQNHVYLIDATNQAEFMQELRSDHVTYLFAEAGTDDALWADADKTDFHLIDQTYGVNRVYEVTLGSTPLSTPRLASRTLK